MNKRAFDVLAMLAMVVGGVGLYVLPVLRYVVLGKALGVPALAMLLFVEAMVGVAHGIHPIRTWSWYRRRDPNERGLTGLIATHALINAAFAALLLILTAPAWERVFGVTAPLWMFAPLALRQAAVVMVTTFTLQGRFLATIAMVLDAMLTLPLVALIGRSLEAAVFVSTTITLILATFTAYTPPNEKLAAKKPSPDADRWRLGDWLRQLAKDIQRPLIVAVAGLSLVVPLVASTTLAGLMLAPFMAAACAKPSEWLTNRLVRGMLVAGIAWAFVHACGPAIYRFLLPASFGDGALMMTLAWSALACIPLALYRDDSPASQRRKAIAGLVGIATLVGLTLTHGLHGSLLAIALAPVIGAQSGLRRSSEREQLG